MKPNSTDKYTYPIGNRITYFRKLKGISVNKLANLAGISQSYLRNIEKENNFQVIPTIVTSTF